MLGWELVPMLLGMKLVASQKLPIKELCLGAWLSAYGLW